jgi:hypothetical protein
MHSPLTDRRIPRPRRRVVATGLSALALAGASTGVATDVASAGAAHTRSHRILEVLSTGNAPGASATMMRQYTDPQSGVRYLLLHQYTARTVNYTSWEADTPRPAGKRSIEQIDVDPAARTYADHTVIRPDAAAPSLGIESTGDQVKRALRTGKATREAMTRVNGSTLLELKISPQDRSTRHDDLDVDPSTDVPVQETKTYTSGRHTFHYLAHFAAATRHAVSEVETKPARPARPING